MRKKYIFQVKGKKYTLANQTWIMGILNVTPDSFSDGGLYYSKEKAIEQGLKLAAEGADILDIGGESTRPGSEPIPPDEEIRRIIPVISEIRQKSDVLISVDTTKSEVCRAALEAGVDIINDISAFRFDPEMFALAAEWQAPVILMHMQGMPKTMQDAPLYSNLLFEVRSFLQERIETATSFGIKRESIVIDPGIGFGKRQEDNLSLIRNLRFLEELDRPILIGASRKSFIGNILGLPPEKRIEGSIAASIVSIINGAHILRVHDVKATKRAIKMAEAILNDSSRVACNGAETKRSYA